MAQRYRQAIKIESNYKNSSKKRCITTKPETLIVYNLIVFVTNLDRADH